MSEIKSVDIKGLLDTYEFPYTLPGSKQELLIKPITTGQMKKILAYESENDPYIIEEALDKLISDCVVTPDFDINQLYLQDRFSLLLEIRRVTKGNAYQFTYPCPKCGVESVVNIDLSGLEVKPVKEMSGKIKVTENLSFEMGFPKRCDEKDAVNRYKNTPMGKYEKRVEIQTATYANSVKKVYTPDGEFDSVPFEDKMYVFENITSDVFSRFTKWFEENEFGTQFVTPYTCNACENREVVDIPLSDFFV